ncbi:MAG: ATP-binding protein [Desulfobulbaceae bacterium]|nr:ATP-binding protein [Desulfobulbaceae bacterium]
MNFQPLRKKINLIFSVVTLAVFLIVALVSGVVEYQRARAEYSRTMQARINVARALIKDALFHTDTMVSSVLNSGPGRSEELFSRLADSSYFKFHQDSFYVLDPQGRVFLISKPYREYIGLDFSAMVPKERGRTRQVHQSLLTKDSVVTIQYALDDGYLLVIERSLKNFTSIMAGFSKGKLYEGEIIFVLSATGRTIYHPDTTLMATRYNLGFNLKSRTVPDDSGLFSFKYNGGSFIALSEQFTEPSDWIIYYSIPKSVMTRAVTKILFNQFASLLLLFFLLFFALHFVFNRFFSQPVSDIVEALKQSKQGNGLLLTSEMSAGIVEFNTIIGAIKSRDKEVALTVERFQAVLDSMDALVYVADIESYELLFVNSFGRNIFGDCVGKTCYLTLQQGQEDPCEFCTNHLLVDEHGEPAGVHVWEFRNTLTGQWFECRDQAIRWTDGRLVRMEIATDISARKQAEAALMEEKERLSVTLRSIGDGVITTDIEGRVLFLNKVAEELTGWENGEAQGRPSTEVFNIINEKTSRKCVSPVQRVIQLGRIVGLANHTALIARDGSVRSIADSGAPIRDRESEIIGVVIVFRDITNEKKMEEELLKVRKLESVGVLAGGIAHDFNNILSGILGNIELAGYRVAQEDSETVSLLHEATKATRRAAKLTGQLLTFSKGGEPVREMAALPELISESADFVLRGSPIVCTYDLPEHLWMVEVDSGQISQVIQNIILNAKHAMPEGGTIAICCTNVHDAATEALLSVDNGNYVRITLQDTGIGIPREILNKIFDPYFTTKQEGSGLGLAICHSIINKHDGYLLVDSVPGKGTTFTIYLPAVLHADDEVAAKPKTASAVQAARVMVMDDEELLRALAKSQLLTLGHEAILVVDGEQAINRYQELQDRGMPVDLVIMDLTIPGGMGGEEAAGKLLQLDAGARIIVASGYSNDPVIANYREHGFCAAITKPFDLAELSRAIESALK